MMESGAVVPAGRLVVGMQLPVQAGGSSIAEEWEGSARQRTLEAIVRKADAAGLFYLAVQDHVAMPMGVSEELGTIWYDPATTLAWVAAMTQRTRVLAYDFVLAYRHPLVVAKAFMTLDTLSQGRAILGLAAGDLEEEFAVLGIPYAQRERLFDRGLDVLRSAFAHEHLNVDTPKSGTISVGLSPRPAQSRLPIWVSGSSMSALRRAAERGDGWLPTDSSRESLGEQIAYLRRRRIEVNGPDRMDIGAIAEPMYIGRPTWELGEGCVHGDGEYLAARILTSPIWVPIMSASGCARGHLTSSLISLRPSVPRSFRCSIPKASARHDTTNRHSTRSRGCRGCTRKQWRRPPPTTMTCGEPSGTN